MDKKIRCAMFPNPYTKSKWMQEANPFLLQTAKELEKLGCECIETPQFPSLAWILFNCRKMDVLHVHWPEQYYEFAWHSNNPLLLKIFGLLDFTAPLRRALGFVWLFAFVQFLRLLRIPLIWTVHEIFPHTSQTPSHLQVSLRKYLAKNADLLLLNCNGVENLIREKLDTRSKMMVVPSMGDYKLFYPNTVDRVKARMFFRLSDRDTMYLFFGTQRPHRNALELMEAFKTFQASSAVMWIIGYAPEKIREKLEQQNWYDWRVHLNLRHVEGHHLECALKACDFLIMPGANYLTSGVIVLAMSYGVPVIAPRYGCAQDMVKEAGILYDDTQPDGLKNALQDALKNKGALQKKARQQMSNWSWQLTAERTYQAYQLAMR